MLCGKPSQHYKIYHEILPILAFYFWHVIFFLGDLILNHSCLIAFLKNAQLRALALRQVLLYLSSQSLPFTHHAWLKFHCSQHWREVQLTPTWQSNNYYLYKPHRWIALFLHADWLVQKWLANIIHLWAAEETKLYVYNNLNSNHFLL